MQCSFVVSNWNLYPKTWWFIGYPNMPPIEEDINWKEKLTLVTKSSCMNNNCFIYGKITTNKPSMSGKMEGSSSPELIIFTIYIPSKFPPFDFLDILPKF